MKESEAAYILERMEFAAQRCRTMAMEESGVEDENEDSKEAWILRDLFPWLFGPKSILIPLSHLNSRIKAGQALDPADFYNMMVIVDRTALLEFYGIREGGESIASFPFPSMKIFSEWEPSKNE